MKTKLTKQQLIDLVEKIRDPENDDADIVAWLALLERSVPHPGVSDLIFWPSKRGLGDNPSAEEIIDKALDYKPIQL